MKRARVSQLAGVLVLSLLLAACSQVATAPAPTLPPAPKAVEPTSAPAPAATPIAMVAVAPTSAVQTARKLDWPEKGKAITFICPVAAGGAADIQVRTLAPLLEKLLGTTVQVVNKAGASGQTGLTDLYTAKADGYTVAQTLLPTLYVTYLDASRKAPYGRKDFLPVANHVFDAQAITVKADSPYKTLKDLVDAAKAKPGEVKISAAGVQSNDHLGILAFEKAANVKFASVQFDGGAPGMTALLGGHLDAAGHTVGSVTSYAKSGTVRVLGVMSEKRSKFFPDVPTLTEQGYPAVLGSYRGYSLKAGTPNEVADILGTAIKKVADDPEMAKKLDDLFLGQSYMGAEAYAKQWDQFETEAKPLLELAKQ